MRSLGPVSTSRRRSRRMAGPRNDKIVLRTSWSQKLLTITPDQRERVRGGAVGCGGITIGACPIQLVVVAAERRNLLAGGVCSGASDSRFLAASPLRNDKSDCQGLASACRHADRRLP